MITLDHGSKNRQFTLIILVNWDLYQGEHDSKDTSDHDEGNIEVTENNQVLDINNNYNNANNEKENKEEEENINIYPRNGEEYSESFESLCLSYRRRIEKRERKSLMQAPSVRGEFTGACRNGQRTLPRSW